MSSQESDEERVIVRRPRNFRERINYNMLQNTYGFNERFRLGFPQFAHLLQQIEGRLQHLTGRNHALGPHQQLEIALHWLGTGTQYHSIGDMHGVSKATVCRVVQKVVNAIDELVVPDIVRWPDNVGEIVNGFSNIAGMPLVCGAVDGTLIKMDALQEFEPHYVDRHGNHSINVMLVCGANLQFFYVYADWPGSVSDARVLRNSGLHQRMQDGWRPFPGAVLLADSIYPLKNWLIPPIIQDPNDPAQRRFARAHKRTRRVIECAIGLMKEKFPCLNYLRLQPEFVCKTVKCCAALCNQARFENVDLEEEQEEEVLENVVHEPVDVLAQQQLNFYYEHFAN